MGIERRFSTCEDVESFCTDLTKGRSEGLCDCVGEGVIPDKAEMCFRPYTSSQRGIPPYIAKSWVKFLQEHDKLHNYGCTCRVVYRHCNEMETLKCIVTCIVFY
jgi:hypothetical protein